MPMNLELENLHVLITGGSKGIGLACARGFLAEGARVTLPERLHEGMQAEARQQGISREEAPTRAKATRPLGRIAEPSEIADAVVYLASNRASYITGAVVAMDGRLRRWWCKLPMRNRQSANLCLNVGS